MTAAAVKSFLDADTISQRKDYEGAVQVHRSCSCYTTLPELSLDTEEFRTLFDWKLVQREVPLIIEPERLKEFSYEGFHYNPTGDFRRMVFVRE